MYDLSEMYSTEYGSSVQFEPLPCIQQEKSWKISKKLVEMVGIKKNFLSLENQKVKTLWKP